MGKVQLCLIIWLSTSIFLGAFVFSRGFLLNRLVITKTSQQCKNLLQLEPEVKDNLDAMVDWCRSPEPEPLNVFPPQPPVFSKVILILVDALRFDFIQRMRFLSKAISNSERLKTGKSASASAHSFKFLADPPTTTMQRLKALMTGTMPTFIDASSNFNSYEVEEDNFIFQSYAARKRIAFLGDDTWLSLFPKRLFTSPFVEAHPSFNAWDLDTVDRAVNSTLRHIVQPSEQSKWDVLIAHFLGVDHCGHRFGPNHPEMQRKLDEADAALELVYESMTPDTLLVVFGDHGMTRTGDHGGDSADETESGLIFLTKTAAPNDFEVELESLTVSQIDLVPTLSVLFGLPIPFSSIGQVIPVLMSAEVYSNALAANVAQVSRYIDLYSSLSNLNQDDKASLAAAYNKTSVQFIRRNTKSGVEEFVKSTRAYLKLMKDVAVNTWTQFDFVSINSGISLCALSIIFLRKLLVTQAPRGLVWKVWTVCTLWCTISSLSVAYYFIEETRILAIIAAVILSLAGFIAFGIRRFDVPATPERMYPEHLRFPEFLALLGYFFTCVAVFSNSFVITEGYVLGFMLLVVTSTQAQISQVFRLTVDGTDEVQFRVSTRGAIHKSSCISFFILGLIVRLGTLFFRCREELQDCQEEFLLHKHLPSLPVDWVVHKYVRFGVALLSLAVLVVCFRIYMISRRCIMSTRPAAIVSRFIPSLVVVLICVSWALQGLPLGLPSSQKSRFFNCLPSVAHSVTLLALCIFWVKPICCVGRLRHAQNSLTQDVPPPQTTKKSKKNPTRVINNGTHSIKNRTLRSPSNGHPNNQDIDTEVGQGNKKVKCECNLERCCCDGSQINLASLSEDVFSSPILVNAILLTLLLVQVSSAGHVPIITLILYSIICLVNISTRMPREKISSWGSIVSWTLASQYFFYATGHQPVFSTIPWDSAFVGTPESSGFAEDSWLSYIRPALAVLGNLHVSQILFSISFPLLVYWRSDLDRFPESQMGKTEMREVRLVGGKFVLLHGVKLLACMCCAALHRRHLMVWKIFAPKFIFEGISFLIVLISVSATMLFVTRLDYLFRKTINQEKQTIRIATTNNSH